MKVDSRFADRLEDLYEERRGILEDIWFASGNLDREDEAVVDACARDVLAYARELEEWNARIDDMREMAERDDQ